MIYYIESNWFGIITKIHVTNSGYTSNIFGKVILFNNNYFGYFQNISKIDVIKKYREALLERLENNNQ